MTSPSCQGMSSLTKRPDQHRETVYPFVPTRLPRHKVQMLSAATVCLTFLASSGFPARSANFTDSQLLRMAAEPDASQSVLVNEFICNSGSIASAHQTPLQSADAQVIARLLTPLNSGFSHQGDPITAVVSEPIKGPLGSALPVGTLLHGYVEDLSPSGRLRHDGRILFKFYIAETPGRRINLEFGLDTGDGAMRPLHYATPPTRKQYLRSLLMMSSHIAIPLAIGSGGLSLGITTGAGALIGGLLADDRRYFRGAARGAWEASGLAIFDPIVCKGKQVIIPWGTRLTLRLETPTNLPRSIFAANLRHPIGSSTAVSSSPFACRSPRAGTTRAVLSTRAFLIPAEEAANTSENQAVPAGDGDDSRPAPDDLLADVEEFLRQKNLAAAMQTLDAALALYPDNPRLISERNKLISLVTGRMSRQ